MQEFDPVVLLASLASVFAVFLINLWLGGYTPARLADADDALARLKLDFPSFEEQATLVGSDGKAAVLAAADGGLALVEAIGDRFLTRLLGPGDISALFLEPSPDRPDGTGGRASSQRLRLRLNDFTNTEFTIALAADANGASWHQRLSAFHNPQEASPRG